MSRVRIHNSYTGRRASLRIERGLDGKKPPKTVLPKVEEIDMSKSATLTELDKKKSGISFLAWRLINEEGYCPTTVVNFGYLGRVTAITLPDGKSYRARRHVIY